MGAYKPLIETSNIIYYKNMNIINLNYCKTKLPNKQTNNVIMVNFLNLKYFHFLLYYYLINF